MGVGGQAIFVNPRLKLVMVQTAVWLEHFDPRLAYDRNVFWRNLNSALAVFLGALLGLGAAFLRELSDRRVRSVDDLKLLVSVPVLAEIGKARIRRGALRRSSSPAFSSR